MSLRRWFRRPPPPCASDEAQQAVTDSAARLEAAEHLETRAGEVSSELGATLRRNHLAAAVRRAIQGTR